jgi:hypothetical protein
VSQEESSDPIELPQPAFPTEGPAPGLDSKKLRTSKEPEEEISQQIAANMYLVFLYR